MNHSIGIHNLNQQVREGLSSFIDELEQNFLVNREVRSLPGIFSNICYTDFENSMVTKHVRLWRAVKRKWRKYTFTEIISTRDQKQYLDTIPFFLKSCVDWHHGHRCAPCPATLLPARSAEWQGHGGGVGWPGLVCISSSVSSVVAMREAVRAGTGRKRHMVSGAAGTFQPVGQSVEREGGR